MTAGVLVCCRCQQGIRPNERAARVDHDRPTGAPCVNHYHGDGCPSPARTPATLSEGNG